MCYGLAKTFFYHMMDLDTCVPICTSERFTFIFVLSVRCTEMVCRSCVLPHNADIAP